MELAQRMTIWKLRLPGNAPLHIINSTVYAMATAFKVLAKFDADGNVQQRCNISHKNQNQAKTFLAGLQDDIKADPTQSMLKHN